MIYRYDKKRNPRLRIMKIGLGALAVIASVVVLLAPPIISVPVFILAAILLFKIWGVYSKLVQSFINVHDEGISGKSPSGSVIRLPFEQVSESGVAVDPNGQRIVFLYDAENDQLVQMPDLYQNFDAMVAELQGYRPMREVHLEEEQTVEDLLRKGFPETNKSGGSSV